MLISGTVETTDGIVEANQRWKSRELVGRLVAALVHLVPVAAAVVVSRIISEHLTSPPGLGGHAREWAVLFGISTAVILVVERISRRLMPLAALLRLSLVFPDQAPRRLAVARRAGSIRNLHARIEHAKTHGVPDEPSRAAGTILELVGALHAHDRRTRGHADRVRVFTDLLAEELRVGPADRDRLRWSALLHDIGKLHVSPRILNKPGRLDEAEWEAIHRHPLDGARLAGPLSSWLGPWADTIAHHHERWDGTGYPHGLERREISYGGRIVAVADAFEVMTAVRSYKKSMTMAAARRELTAQAGAQFDPAIVRAFLQISVGRLRWAASPLSWVAQLPFIRWVPHAADGVAAAAPNSMAGLLGTAAGMTVVAGTVGVTAGASFLSHSVASAGQIRVSQTVRPAAYGIAATPRGTFTSASTSVPSNPVGPGPTTTRSSMSYGSVTPPSTTASRNGVAPSGSGTTPVASGPGQVVGGVGTVGLASGSRVPTEPAGAGGGRGTVNGGRGTGGDTGGASGAGNGSGHGYVNGGGSGHGWGNSEGVGWIGGSNSQSGRGQSNGSGRSGSSGWGNGSGGGKDSVSGNGSGSGSSPNSGNGSGLKNGQPGTGHQTSGNQGGGRHGSGKSPAPANLSSGRPKGMP